MPFVLILAGAALWVVWALATRDGLSAPPRPHTMHAASSTCRYGRQGDWSNSTVIVPAVFREWGTDTARCGLALVCPPAWLMQWELFVYQRLDANIPCYCANRGYEAGVYISFMAQHYLHLPARMVFVQADYFRQPPPRFHFWQPECMTNISTSDTLVDAPWRHYMPLGRSVASFPPELPPPKGLDYWDAPEGRPSRHVGADGNTLITRAGVVRHGANSSRPIFWLEEVGGGVTFEVVVGCLRQLLLDFGLDWPLCSGSAMKGAAFIAPQQPSAPRASVESGTPESRHSRTPHTERTELLPQGKTLCFPIKHRVYKQNNFIVSRERVQHYPRPKLQELSKRFADEGLCMRHGKGTGALPNGTWLRVRDSPHFAKATIGLGMELLADAVWGQLPVHNAPIVTLLSSTPRSPRDCQQGSGY